MSVIIRPAMDSHHSLILDAAELGKDGVETLAAQLRHVYTTDYRALLAELEHNADLSPQEREEMQDKLRLLEAEFDAHMTVLDEIRAAYEALPADHADLIDEHGHERVAMSTAIELAENSIKLRKIYDELQSAAADRLFA
jgi:hypothetical protein